MKTTKKYFYHFALIASLFVSTKILYNNSRLPKLSLKMQQSTINIDDQILRILDMGLHRAIASFLWTETLLRSDIDHYKGKEFNNWMFLRLKTITSLDPYFYQAYLNGGVYLSIVKDDDLGAEYIYDRGLNYYSEKYYLGLNAAFHYLFELDKVQKSIKALEGISENIDKVNYATELLARLKSTQGDKTDAFNIILRLYNQSEEGSVFKKKYHTFLYSIKAELDLKCLNSKPSSNCSLKDFDGVNYLLNPRSNLWKAKKEWKIFKTKRAMKNN